MVNVLMVVAARAICEEFSTR